jgi:hypothetical protein
MRLHVFSRLLGGITEYKLFHGDEAEFRGRAAGGRGDP